MEKDDSNMDSSKTPSTVGQEEPSAVNKKDTSEDNVNDEGDSSAVGAADIKVDGVGGNKEEKDDENATGDKGEHELSEYELKRLERIKRNNAILNNLGLKGASQLLKNGNSSKKERKRKPRAPVEETDKRESARIRKSVSYKDKSLAAYIRDSMGEEADFTGMRKRKRKETSDKEKCVKVKKPLRIQQRPEHLIMNEYDREIPMSQEVLSEYWRIYRERKRARKIAEQNLRQADIELRSVNNQIAREKQKRELQVKKSKVEYASLIRARVLKLRSLKLNEERMKAKEMTRINATVEIIRERYRKLIREHEKKLQSNLVKALPDGKSIIRKLKEDQRSRRKSEAAEKQSIVDKNKENGYVDTAENEPVKPKIRKKFTATKIILIDDDYVEDNARKVGGPISSEYSKRVQRSWLSRDTSTPLDDLKFFVPQVGDTVL